MLDENVQASVAEGLRGRGVDAATVWEWGLEGATDEDLLREAAKRGRVVVTYNVRDFVKLHIRWVEEGRKHCGIIVSRQVPIGEMVKRLEKTAKRFKEEEMANRLLFLSEIEG